MILVVSFSDGSRDVGTGAFVDHDGLVLTADHVLRGIRRPPENYVGGDPGAGKKLTSIEVYSFALHTKFNVPITDVAHQVVSGALPNSKWLHFSLFRVTLPSNLRPLVHPLDLATDVPIQGQALWAYGPKCLDTDHDGSPLQDCLQPSLNSASLSNIPRGSTLFEVSSILSLGFSGGPLVNDNGAIVAVCSWGETLTLSTKTASANYTPVIYFLRYYRKLLPQSSFFSSSTICTELKDYQVLTELDWEQLSRRWTTASTLTPQSGQCICCCDSLNKTENALVDLPVSAANCGPPFCTPTRLYATVRSMQVVLDSDASDTTALRNLYAAASSLYREVAAQGGASDRKLRAQIFRAYGETLSSISRNPLTREDAAFSDSTSLALNAFMRSQVIDENASVYGQMAQLFLAEGKTKGAAAASVLKDYRMALQLDPAGAAASYKALKIDPGRLKATLGSETAVGKVQ